MSCSIENWKMCDESATFNKRNMILSNFSYWNLIAFIYFLINPATLKPPWWRRSVTAQNTLDCWLCCETYSIKCFSSLAFCDIDTITVSFFHECYNNSVTFVLFLYKCYNNSVNFVALLLVSYRLFRRSVIGPLSVISSPCYW